MFLDIKGKKKMSNLMTKRVRKLAASALGITEEKVTKAVADKDDLYTALAKYSKYNREQVKHRMHAAMYGPESESFKKLRR